MMTSVQLIPEFIQSLQQEIDTLKKGKGGSTVRVFNGRFLRKTSGLFIYLFHLENFLAVIDDTPAEIEIEGKRYSGQIVSVQGLEVQIAIEKNLGRAVAEAKIQINLWFLLELLRKKFEESISSASGKFKMSEKLFNGLSTTIDGRDAPEYVFSKDPPNDSQGAAINASFSKSLAVIWGPPGTGKTKTIAKAVEAHLKAGRRVLLVSHANAAVDEALEDIAEQLKPTSFYQEGKLIRLGICHKKTLEDEYPLVILDKIAAKLGESLTREKNKLLVEREQIDRFLKSSLVDVQKMSEKATKERDVLIQSLSNLNGQLGTEEAALGQLEENQEKNREKLARAKQAGAVKRFFWGLDPQKIQQEIDRLSIAVDSKRRTVTELKQRHNETKSSLSEKEAELSKINKEYSRLLAEYDLTPEKLKTEKQARENRKDAINSRIAEIDKALDEIQKRILSEARLVATTLTRTFTSKQFPDQPFDVLIVDESSMVPLPHLYWAAGKATSFVTIVGDFNQLPPICVAREAMAKKWLGRSIFDILNITSVNDARNDERVILLKIQYRMAPKIADVPNRLFYEGLLENAPDTKNLVMKDSLSGEASLVIVDTSTINPWCSHLSTGGRFNIYSALVSMAVARKLKDKIKEGKVGIIAPYRAQARLAGKIAEDWGILDRVRINTVHSFQGGEEKVIVLDCMEGPGVSNWSMLDDKRPDSDARLLLNVALTRAKYKVFLVAHKDHLYSALKKDSIIIRIMDIFSAEGLEISSEDLVDSYLVADFEKWASAAIGPESRVDASDSDFYTEKNFWPVFLNDLRSTKESLIIMSPFVSLNRAGKLMDFFKVLPKKGVMVCIYTRPPFQQSGRLSEHAEQVINQFENYGFKVIQRKGMHQKIALIDGKIAWEGSLNILSHKDTQEQMRRFEGENTVQEIARNLELDKVESGSSAGILCPRCLENGMEISLVQKQGRYGMFWGCPRFPACRYTENISRRGRN